MIILWGGYRILEKGVRDMDCKWLSPVGVSGGICPQRIFKNEVLRNVISAILRLSQGVVIPQGVFY